MPLLHLLLAVKKKKSLCLHRLLWCLHQLKRQPLLLLTPPLLLPWALLLTPLLPPAWLLTLPKTQPLLPVPLPKPPRSNFLPS